MLSRHHPSHAARRLITKWGFDRLFYYFLLLYWKVHKGYENNILMTPGL
jgi:hypothetical protein